MHDTFLLMLIIFEQIYTYSLVSFSLSLIYPTLKCYQYLICLSSYCSQAPHIKPTITVLCSKSYQQIDLHNYLEQKEKWKWRNIQETEWSSGNSISEFINRTKTVIIKKDKAISILINTFVSRAFHFSFDSEAHD